MRELEVVSMENYNHSRLYELPIKPSPNLPDMVSIYLYPTLCFFEGAKVSVGRGTEFPFKVYGFPGFTGGTISFTPVDIPGVITNPPYEGQLCNAVDLRDKSDIVTMRKQLIIEWLIEMYNAYPDKEKFFNNFFDKLAGTDQLRKDIIGGKTASEIRLGWSEDLNSYRKLRSKYVLYAD